MINITTSDQPRSISGVTDTDTDHLVRTDTDNGVRAHPYYQLTVCVSVCYLLAPWRAGVGWRGAGDVQGAGATAGGGGASNPDRETQTAAVILRHTSNFQNHPSQLRQPALTHRYQQIFRA